MRAFKSVLLTENDFEKLDARYSREFEVIIDCFSSYIEFKIEAKALLLVSPKMDDFGLSGQKILWNF